MKHSLKTLFLIVLIVVVVFSVVPNVPAQGANTNDCDAPPPHGCLILSLNAFYESNHTAILSVHFDAYVLASGAQLGSVGLMISDQPENVFHSSNIYMSNGTYLDQNKTSARWTYNIAVNLRSLGSNDFYPYDSWLFGVTLLSPFLAFNQINSTNSYMSFQNFLTDWVEVCPYGCFVENAANQVVTTFVLSRTPGGTFVPAAYVPWILWFILGIAVLIPPDDLASKATVYTSIIFFLGGLLFTRVLSFQSSGSSYVENTLYYILFLTSLYLSAAIFERLLSSRRRSVYKSILRVAIELGFAAFAIELLSRQYATFTGLLRMFWWVSFPIIQTLYFPAFLVSWATAVNICLILVEIRRIRREQAAPSPVCAAWRRRNHEPSLVRGIQ